MSGWRKFIEDVDWAYVYLIESVIVGALLALLLSNDIYLCVVSLSIILSEFTRANLTLSLHFNFFLD